MIKPKTLQYIAILTLMTLTSGCVTGNLTNNFPEQSKSDSLLKASQPDNSTSMSTPALKAKSGIKITTHDEPDIKPLDITDFKCDDILCSSRIEEFKEKYGCRSLSNLNKYAGALEPALPVLLCNHGDTPEAQKITDESDQLVQGYSPHASLIEFLVIKDKQIQHIKTKSEFRKLFGPVTSENEALAFATTLTKADANYDLIIPESIPIPFSDENKVVQSFVNTAEETHVETKGEEFIVHLFDSHIVCNSDDAFDAVSYSVSKDGVVKEISRTKLYTHEPTACR